MKYLLTIFLFISLKSVATNYHFSSGDVLIVENVNSRGFFGGDTLFIDSSSASTRTYIYLENFLGTPTNPIVISNYGYVNLRSGIHLENCRYVVISGSGAVGSTTTNYSCGLRLEGYFTETVGGVYQDYANSGLTAVGIHGVSGNIRVHHVEITKAKYGFVMKNDEECDTTLNFPNGFMDSIEIDHNYIHFTESQGMYIGTTQANNSTVQSRVVNCNGTNYYFNPGRTGNWRIHDNMIRGTGRGGIQLSVAEVGRSLIYNNTIRRTGGQTDDGQGGGITLGSYTIAIVYDNDIDSTYTYGGIDYGTKTVWYNNTINHSGYTVHSIPDTSVNLSWPRNFVKESRGMEAWFSGIALDSIELRLWYNTFNNASVINNALLTYSWAVGGTNPSLAFWTDRIYHKGNTYNGTNIAAGSTRIENTAGLTLTESGGLSVIPPVVNAGRDYVFYFKVKDADTTIYGGASGLEGKTISSLQWTQVSGASTATFGSPTAAQTTVSNLVTGFYEFKLTATDSDGIIDSDKVVIQVENGNTPEEPYRGFKLNGRRLKF